MAYADGDYRFVVRGNFSTEQWNNVWSFRQTAPPAGDIQDIADALHAFYLANDVGNLMSAAWSAVGCTAHDLFAGDSIELDFTTIGGTGADPLPPQCAIRLSITSAPNIRGGPFLCGFDVNQVDGAGGATSACIAELQTNANALFAAAQTALFELCVDSPSTPALATATAARLGERFDVIRKRANDLAESYTPLVVP